MRSVLERKGEQEVHTPWLENLTIIGGGLGYGHERPIDLGVAEALAHHAGDVYLWHVGQVVSGLDDADNDVGVLGEAGGRHTSTLASLGARMTCAHRAASTIPAVPPPTIR